MTATFWAYLMLALLVGVIGVIEMVRPLLKEKALRDYYKRLREKE